MRYSVRHQCRTQAHEVSRSDPHTYDKGCLSWYWWLQGRFSCCKIWCGPSCACRNKHQYFWTSYINIKWFQILDIWQCNCPKNYSSCQSRAEKSWDERENLLPKDLQKKTPRTCHLWSASQMEWHCIWGWAPILTNPSTVTVPNPLPNAMILLAWKLPSLQLSLSGDTPTNSKSMQTTGPTQSSCVKVVQISDPVSNNATWWIWPWLLAI